MLQDLSCLTSRYCKTQQFDNSASDPQAICCAPMLYELDMS